MVTNEAKESNLMKSTFTYAGKKENGYLFYVNDILDELLLSFNLKDNCLSIIAKFNYFGIYEVCLSYENLVSSNKFLAFFDSLEEITKSIEQRIEKELSFELVLNENFTISSNFTLNGFSKKLSITLNNVLKSEKDKYIQWIEKQYFMLLKIAYKGREFIPKSFIRSCMKCNCVNNGTFIKYNDYYLCFKCASENKYI